MLKATSDQVAAVSRIVEIVDTEYPKERAESVSQTFHLAHMKASAAREVLLALFDAPGLKQCEVERVWEVLPGTGQELSVTATRGQVERVAALIREIDMAKPGEPATGGKGRGAIGPTVEEAPFQLAATRRVSVPMLLDLPILNRMPVREEPTSILIEAKGAC